MALDDYPFSFEHTQKLTGGVLVSGEDLASMRTRRRGGTDVEAWSVRWELLTQASFQALVAELDTIGYSGSADWTSPEDGAARPYRVRRGTRRDMVTRGEYAVEAELEYVPGVE